MIIGPFVFSKWVGHKFSIVKIQKEKMIKFLKRKFPNLFYKIDNHTLYRTDDGVGLAYNDHTLEIVLPNTSSSFVFDIRAMEQGSIIIAKKLDPFKVILSLETDFLYELREQYEDAEEFEICDFISKEIKKRGA